MNSQYVRTQGNYLVTRFRDMHLGECYVKRDDSGWIIDPLNDSLKCGWSSRLEKEAINHCYARNNINGPLAQ